MHFLVPKNGCIQSQWNHRLLNSRTDKVKYWGKLSEANYNYWTEHTFSLLSLAKSELTYWLSNKRTFGVRKCRWWYESAAEHGLMAKTEETECITQLLNILLKFPKTHFYRYIGVSDTFTWYTYFLHFKIKLRYFGTEHFLVKMLALLSF